MRLLVHGMQSSGATAFTLMLAQRPDCLALVDVPNNFAAPRVATSRDFVAKVVVTTAYPLSVHVERFRPDRVVLFLRDPRDTYMSLRTKHYRNHSGLIAEKFAILDALFASRDRFDAVIEYEDFVTRHESVHVAMRRLGWPVDARYYAFERRHKELLAALWEHEPALMDAMDFAFGAVRDAQVSERHQNKPRDPDVEAVLTKWCPRLLSHYCTRQTA